MSKVTVPFLFVNPKSYLWGKESLELALACDKISAKTGVMIFFTCPLFTLVIIYYPQFPETLFRSLFAPAATIVQSAGSALSGFTFIFIRSPCFSPIRLI